MITRSGLHNGCARELKVGLLDLFVKRMRSGIHFHFPLVVLFLNKKQSKGVINLLIRF